jgi:MFS family permease
VTPVAGQPITRQHWLVVVGATLLVTIGGATFLSFTFVNPGIADALGVSLSSVLVYNSLMSLAGLPSMIMLAPWLLRRVGARRALVGYALWQGAMLYGLSSVTSLPMLYVIGFALGLSFGAGTHMMASYLITTWFVARRGSTLGAVMAISGFGGIAVGLGMPLLVTGVGWQGAFRVLAVISLVVMAVTGLLLVRTSPADVGLLAVGEVTSAPAHPDVVVRVPGVPLRRALRSPQLWLLALGVALYQTVQAIQQTITSVYVASGVSIVEAGTLVSILSGCLVFTTLAVGTVNDRYGTTVAVGLAAVAQAVSMLLLWLAGSYLSLALATAVMAFGSALPTVLVAIIVMTTFGPADYAGVLGVVMSFIPVGMAVGAPLWGLSKDVTGSYAPALWAAAAVSLVAAVMLIQVLRSAPSFRALVDHEVATGRI